MALTALRAAIPPLAVVSCHGAPSRAPSNAGREVLAALMARGQVSVVVALIEPAGYADPRNASASRAAISRMQQAVVADVDGADFRATTFSAAIPAFAGIFPSEGWLRRLLGHPHVRTVSLDDSGSGSS